MGRWIQIALLHTVVPILITIGCSPTPYRGETDISTPRTNTPTRHLRCEQFLPLIKEIALSHHLDLALVVGVIRVESNFKARARSRVGARGLMQVMPSTGRGMGCTSLYDPRSNIQCGAKVLRVFLDRYEGNLIYGLSAYNGGYALASPSSKKQRVPKNFRYVEKVLKARGQFLRSGCKGLYR